MSKKFTGITSAGSAIPVYDKDAHSALEQKLDTSAFSSVSGEFATVDDVVAAVSGKADTSAIPSLDGYATEEWVGEQGYLTEVPESAVSGFATHEEVNSATSGKLDTTAASGFVPLSGSSAMSGDFIIAPYGLEYPPVLSANVYGLHIRAAANAPYSQLTYGDLQFRNSPAGRITDSSARFSYDPGVEIYAPTFGSNYPRAVIIVKGTDVNSATISSFIVQQPTSANNRPIIKTHDQGDSIEWHSVTGKLDASAADNFIQKSESGEFQAAGDYYSASNPSGFLVPDDITGKQDASAMTAYQPVGDYQPSGDYLSASESANFYPMTGNPSGFLTEHQSLDGLMETSGLEYDGDKISGYMGSAFAGGGEVPEGVMVESAVGYNAVNEISGYNGSAIAQYGAEKQWLVHDDTLVHAANSAQYALGVNLSAVAQLLGVDETVLYSGIKNIGNAGTATYNLNESPMNFKTIKVLWCLRADTIGDIANKGVGSFEFEPDQFAQDYTYVHAVMNGANTTDTFTPYDIDTNINNIKTSAWNVKSVLRSIPDNGQWFHIYSIIGIGRKEV